MTVVHAPPLEKRQPLIRGFGCHVPTQKMSFVQAALLMEKDMHTARQHIYGETGSYFARKAKLIEGRFAEHMRRAAGERERMFNVGYEPGRKFIYPGLPVDFAISIDHAILDVIELMADCRHVAMTGSCCAGHPSELIGNPYLEGAMEDPRFAAETRDRHAFEEGILTSNLSPHFRVMLFNNGIGEKIAGRLAAIRTEKTIDGKASIRITARLMDDNDACHDGAITLPIAGVPAFHSPGGIPGYKEFVRLYQEALASFWGAVQSVFESMGGGRAPEPDPSAFTHYNGAGWDREYALIRTRAANGRKLPNYLYFDGVDGNGGGMTMEPELAGAATH